ncbi:MAG: penicillin acylase family protein [Phenylobacterium sp.]|uniref:penicillin acylase family protein n=1 Tax=Phenylobacterium sp. TaxID=1871053 RepID=UPI0027168BED|nr:penicillin acylase family protein [Phenylobacterium sp.]MDO8901205.1 penicillin acylase family protein [Phenylobacterium sp.]
MGRRLRRRARHGLLGLALAGLAVSAAAEPARSAYQVAGLSAPAEILIDRWGISHIYAASVRDAFFLQGYNVARDRLWQIDLWRKRGLGLLAEDFGPDFAAQDRASRLFLYRGDMAAEWAAYGPQARGYAEAFTAGINAYVGEIQAGSRPMPEEFQVTGTTPDLWTPQDVVRIRSHGLTRNAAAEVERARITCAAGLEANALNRRLEPDHTLSIPEGMDPCAIPAEVLGDYRLATQGVTFKAGQVMALAEDIPADAIGSNNWTVAPSRTATGRPILANDPHRAHGVPSLRYIVHMEAPGFSAIGAGEPALPGISIGHNGTIAFGLTIFPADQEDLYVYETDPSDPNRYRYGAGWAAMEVVTETLEVAGQAPQTVELKFTRHGPVVFEDPEAHRAYAVRSVWSDPGTSAYFGSADYMTAQNWGEFSTAMGRFGTPSENQVYADTDGNIGWIAAGRVPVRQGWDGLMPVPGDGRYEWQGFMDAADLPSRYNPEQGWLATANQFNLPDTYPADRVISFEWSNPSRMTRIAEVLDADASVTLADAMALQTDPTNVTAAELIPLLVDIKAPEPRLAQAIALLQAWDGRTEADSAAAALYEVWLLKHLGQATVRAAAPVAAQALIGGGDQPAISAYLAAASPAERGPILSGSLTAALDEVSQKLGPDPAAWTWGDLHQARFEHALAPLLPADAAERLAVGPAPMAGTMLSPLAASWRASDYRVVSGASFRMVLDVGAWDNSMAINTPGQSGDPASPHYRDLFPLWANGEYVPLLYSRPAIEAATATVMTLTPAP